MISVKAFGNLRGVKPNMTNIDNGRYTLVRPFLFVFNEEPVGEAKSFLEICLEPIVSKNYF